MWRRAPAPACGSPPGVDDGRLKYLRATSRHSGRDEARAVYAHGRRGGQRGYRFVLLICEAKPGDLASSPRVTLTATRHA